MMARADIAVVDADPAMYDAVVFVGGPGASVYFDDVDAQALAQRASQKGKVVGAICIAPSVLAHAGLLDGREATAFPSQRDDLIAHGARFTGAPVEIDLPFVTANGPEAARDFGSAIADAIGLAQS